MHAERLGDVAAACGATLHGDPERAVARLAPLDAAGPDAVSFLSNPLYAKQLATTGAAAVIVAAGHAEALVARGVAALVAADPYLAFARLTQWWAARHGAVRSGGVHPSAVVADDAVLGEGVTVDALAVVATGCRVGAGSYVGPRAALLAGTVLGARCIVHAGAVIGADGFGFAPDRGAGGAGATWVKIEQLGRVVLGDDVEVGANTCIDRGALGDTVIGDGVKIDNLVQIGHNVHVGAHTAIAGCVGIAGSTHIGAHCMIGGGVGITGHVTIADGVVLSGATQVTRSITKPGRYGGPFPFDDNAAWEKNAAVLRNLHALRERVRALEKKNAPP